MRPETPYYLIDEKKLLKNLKKIEYVRKASGARSLLALKCFSTWSVFKLMRQYMDGTTSSSLFEARLGHEKFGKETHAYCVAFSKKDVKEIVKFSDTVIFNSISQLKAFYKDAKGLNIGLRINPGISYSHFDLADPARKFSRLGVTDTRALGEVSDKINGFMFHFNCENDDFSNLSSNLDFIGRKFGGLLRKVKWVSFGGGIYFTKDNYPFDKFCLKLKKFSEDFGVQVYLEPGESAITMSAQLITTVQDIVHNGMDTAIVDASTEAHMLDLLIYGTKAKIDEAKRGKHKYIVAGRSCLAGDVFGTYRFNSRLRAGSVIKINDAAGYSMVKKNWFNGLQMPSIVVKRLNGKTEVVRIFDYKDFERNLS